MTASTTEPKQQARLSTSLFTLVLAGGCFLGGAIAGINFSGLEHDTYTRKLETENEQLKSQVAEYKRITKEFNKEVNGIW